MFGDYTTTLEEKQEINDLYYKLKAQVNEVRAKIATLQTPTKGVEYTNQLDSIMESALMTSTNVVKGTVASKEYLNQARIQFGTVWPTAVTKIAEYVAMDAIDATGQKSQQAREGVISSIAAAEESRRWVTDTGEKLTETLTATGKTVLGFQLGLLKSLWPVLVIGGGVAALYFLGPEIKVWLARRRMKQAVKPTPASATNPRRRRSRR